MISFQSSRSSPTPAETEYRAWLKTGSGLIGYLLRQEEADQRRMPSHVTGLAGMASAPACRCSKPWKCTCSRTAYFGGLVKAPPGPPTRDTGMINVRHNGGYVLPAQTVRAVGGVRVLNDLVQRTTGRRPVPIRAIPIPRGLVGFAPGYVDGGDLGGSDFSSDLAQAALTDSTPISFDQPSTSDWVDNGQECLDPSQTTYSNTDLPPYSGAGSGMDAGVANGYGEGGSFPHTVSDFASPPPEMIGDAPNVMGVYPWELGIDPSQTGAGSFSPAGQADPGVNSYGIMDFAHDSGHSLMNGAANVADIPSFLSGSTQGSALGNWLRNNAPPLSPESVAVHNQIAQESTWLGKATIAAQNPGVFTSDVAGLIPPFAAGLGAGAAAEGSLLWGGAPETFANLGNSVANIGVGAGAAGAGAKADPNNGCPLGPDGDSCRQQAGVAGAEMSGILSILWGLVPK